MKKIKLLLGIALIAAFGVFTSCEEEKTHVIEITESNVPDSIEVGTAANLQFSIISDQDLKSIELRKGTETLDLKEDGFKQDASDSYSYSYTATENEAGTSLSFALIVTDKDDF